MNIDKDDTPKVNNLVGTNLINSLINELFVRSKQKYLNNTNDANVETIQDIMLLIVADGIILANTTDKTVSNRVDKKPRKQ